MQIKKVVEGIIGSVENKIEDSSKSSESKTKAFQGGISTAPKDLFEESQIKEAEKRHEKERDAAWMAFGTSVVAASATAGMGAAAGIGSSAASIGSAAAAAGGAAATGISSAANEAIASKKGAPQEAETKKAALADKTISEILSAKLTATQAATQAAVSVVTGGAAVIGTAVSAATGVGCSRRCGRSWCGSCSRNSSSRCWSRSNWCGSGSGQCGSGRRNRSRNGGKGRGNCGRCYSSSYGYCCRNVRSECGNCGRNSSSRCWSYSRDSSAEQVWRPQQQRKRPLQNSHLPLLILRNLLSRNQRNIARRWKNPPTLQLRIKRKHRN